MTSYKHPFELAALATAAMPGLRVTELRDPQIYDDSVQIVGIVDAQGDAWLVVAPQVELSENEVARVVDVCNFLGQEAASGILPFAIPQIGGVVRLDDGNVFVFRRPGGARLDDNEGLGDTLLAASLGASLGTLHNLLPQRFVQGGIEVETPKDTRNKIRAMIGSTGRRIPATLKRRWLAAVDEEVLWSYTPTPIHADLSAKSIWVEMGAVIAIMDFWKMKIGDPASDIAWMLPLGDDFFLDRFATTYAHTRTEPDLHLMTRAQLYSELALVEWLNYGLHIADGDVINEAEAMLSELDADLGGAWLIRPSKPVAEIEFDPTDEPLERFNASHQEESVLDGTAHATNTAVTENVSVEEMSVILGEELAETGDALEADANIASYEYPPLRAEDVSVDELHTEDLSEIVDEILSSSEDEQ